MSLLSNQMLKQSSPCLPRRSCLSKFSANINHSVVLPANYLMNKPALCRSSSNLMPPLFMPSIALVMTRLVTSLHECWRSSPRNPMALCLGIGAGPPHGKCRKTRWNRLKTQWIAMKSYGGEIRMSLCYIQLESAWYLFLQLDTW